MKKLIFDVVTRQRAASISVKNIRHKYFPTIWKVFYKINRNRSYSEQPYMAASETV